MEAKKIFKEIIDTDIPEIGRRHKEVKNFIDSQFLDVQEYLNSLLEQIPHTNSAPLIPKTPKVGRKKNTKRIETIPEDIAVNNETRTRSSILANIKVEISDQEGTTPCIRSKRTASLKAAASIYKQQSESCKSKLRRPPENDDTFESSRVTHSSRVTRIKRTKSVVPSSDDEDSARPAKYIKMSNKNSETGKVKVATPTRVTMQETYVADEKNSMQSKRKISQNNNQDGNSTLIIEPQKKLRSFTNSMEALRKKSNVVDESTDSHENDITMEPSLYEDAVSKSTPMNSTMNPNSTVTFDKKMMNVTVVLDNKLNMTTTIKKSMNRQPSFQNDTLVNEESPTEKVITGSPRSLQTVYQSRSTLKESMKTMKRGIVGIDVEELLTEDESSPERNVVKKTKKQIMADNKPKKRFTRSSLLSEDADEVTGTPAKPVLRDLNGLKLTVNQYKSGALFSPYAKDSVKKRVEAFEQAGLNSPKSIDVDAPTRVTRTKTRAMTAAEAKSNTSQAGPTIAQKLARKSVAKAKKISLVKQKRENDETKENNVVTSAQKPSRIAVNEKLIQKQQQRTTPIGKSRLQMPMSVNRIQYTPANNAIINNNKAMTTSKSAMVPLVDCFLPQSKGLAISNSTDNLAEKKRKLNDEDARRKREEALRALTDEKRKKREQKELKNKLARENKEKQDKEKRLKLEREREEKARAAIILQERQREEAERKRILQLQRAHEKEERRKQEEHLRLQRLQEQEEAERQLAEQKRREQEAERRRLAEARAQQMAAAEATRLKANHAAKTKQTNANNKNHQGPISYVLDSDPEDDETDDESKPKHVIPHWALPNVRQGQLNLQEYIPSSHVRMFFGSEQCTPDLSELFENINKNRLKRTSSAIWKTPPRFSMMRGD